MKAICDDESYYSDFSGIEVDEDIEHVCEISANIKVITFTKNHVKSVLQLSSFFYGMLIWECTVFAFIFKRSHMWNHLSLFSAHEILFNTKFQNIDNLLFNFPNFFVLFTDLT